MRRFVFAVTVKTVKRKKFKMRLKSKFIFLCTKMLIAAEESEYRPCSSETEILLNLDFICAKVKTQYRKRTKIDPKISNLWDLIRISGRNLLEQGIILNYYLKSLIKLLSFLKQNFNHQSWCQRIEIWVYKARFSDFSRETFCPSSWALSSEFPEFVPVQIFAHAWTSLSPPCYQSWSWNDCWGDRNINFIFLSPKFFPGCSSNFNEDFGRWKAQVGPFSAFYAHWTSIVDCWPAQNFRFRSIAKISMVN